MKSGRFFIFLIFLLIWWGFPASNAFAFWEFGEEKGESGLDFERGYDLNTVKTVTGKVISVESADGSGPVTITMRRGEEIIHAVAAPKWFWFDRGISIKPGDELRVVGAKAQGKDGEMYIISQEISNITSGEEAVIRDKSGRPAWKGGGAHGTGRRRRYAAGFRRREEGPLGGNSNNIAETKYNGGKGLVHETHHHGILFCHAIFIRFSGFRR